MAEYDLTPVDVPAVSTRYRTIRTAIPVPESLPILEELRRSEPRCMQGQPPVVWHHGDAGTVSDAWGNRWIDWSSGVLVTNAGHAHPRIREAVRRIVDQGLLAAYAFPHEGRATLVRMLREISPDPARYRVFLLSTGSEAVESCLKLAKTYALEKHGPRKKHIVGFQNAFHGRTLGAQLAGGMDRLKTWIDCACPTFIQAPFPDGYKNPDTSFDLFLRTLRDRRVAPAEIAGVMSESYQGVGPDFFPAGYAKKLEAFCREHDIVLIMDEVQSGFGRTGRMFCFEHYGIRPDLIACGKGISSSLPLAAVIGREDILGLYPPGSMTSTHSGSPVAVAAAVANLDVIRDERLAERAARLEPALMSGLARVRRRHASVLGCLRGKGLVAGIQAVKAGTRAPNPDLAFKVNVACLRRGLLMFAPVGVGGECIKIAPPLTVPEDALQESLDVFAEAVEEVL